MLGGKLGALVVATTTTPFGIDSLKLRGLYKYNPNQHPNTAATLSTHNLSWRPINHRNIRPTTCATTRGKPTNPSSPKTTRK